LRNPLAPIRSAISILNSGVASAGQLQGARDVIDRQVRHMSRLLDDLLDVSRVTRGTFELKREYVDLKSVCEIAIETALPLIEAKRHALTMDLPSDPVTIETDPVRLAQVISNLLTNAAKYTDPEGQIRLSAVITEAGLALSVADNGIGLSAKSIPHLFSIFSQVDSRTDRAQGGLGIGLALVKGLVELHGGSVEVRSDGLGRGSEFVVRLPSRLVGSRAQRLPETIDAVPLSMQTDALKILVVDDNRDAAETLSLALGFSGYEVVTAFSGPEALAVGARERPRVVILDVGMPGMDGYETVRRLRLEPWGHHALAIALTGWGQEQDKRAARAAGFDEHLTKPIDPARIDEMVARHLAMQRAGAALRLSAVHE
jgi:CheY-like chemotaxis protein/two-component sensor histidine kinase